MSQPNQVCQSCQNFDGNTYEGNYFNCAIHPYGLTDDKCDDYKQGYGMIILDELGIFFDSITPQLVFQLTKYGKKAMQIPEVPIDSKYLYFPKTQNYYRKLKNFLSQKK